MLICAGRVCPGSFLRQQRTVASTVCLNTSIWISTKPPLLRALVWRLYRVVLALSLGCGSDVLADQQQLGHLLVHICRHNTPGHHRLGCLFVLLGPALAAAARAVVKGPAT